MRVYVEVRVKGSKFLGAFDNEVEEQLDATDVVDIRADSHTPCTMILPWFAVINLYNNDILRQTLWITRKAV